MTALRAAVFVAMSWSAAAQAQPFRDWQVVEADGDCLLLQSLLSRTSGAMLAQVILQRDQGGTTLALRVPTGASLASGIGYRVGAGPLHELDWMHCDAALCLAVRPLSDDELRSILRGREMTVGFRPLPGSRPLNLPVSLMGVTAGWRALERCLPPLP
jgi:invasion protein IalB